MNSSVTEVFSLIFVYEAIKDVLFFSPGFLKNNGLNLVTIEGKEFRFTLKQRNTWGRMIASLC
jgi:hypothetical protein